MKLVLYFFCLQRTSTLDFSYTTLEKSDLDVDVENASYFPDVTLEEFNPWWGRMLIFDVYSCR